MERAVIKVSTHSKNQIIDITKKVEEIIRSKSVKDGFVMITVPHTTAGITINESYDPDVMVDFIYSMNKISPNYSNFRHGEGNSDSHIKASLTGRSEQLVVFNGHLDLGTWEGIWFCEYDGPRDRKVYIYY